VAGRRRHGRSRRSSTSATAPAPSPAASSSGPIPVLIGGGAIIADQVFAVQVIRPAFENSDNPTLESINVQSVVDAAVDTFPRWFLFNVYAGFVLATLGSLVVIVLLACPPANAYFRKDGRGS
jgi:hypothetical protein